MRGYEVAIGTYSQRGMAWQASRLEAIPLDVPAWHSVFRFDMDELGQFLDEHGALNSSYHGSIYLDSHFFLDLDGPLARKDVLAALALLQSKAEEKGAPLNDRSFRVFLSGGKGFHVWLPIEMLAPSVTHANLKDTIKLHFGHLESLDLTMYNRAGLIRVPWSIHNKSGLRCIPIRVEVIVRSEENGDSYEQMYERAAHRENLGDVENQWMPTWADVPLLSAGRVGLERTRTKVIGAQAMTNRVSCMQKMVRDEAPPGHRHEYVLRAASWLRRLGLPQELVDASMQEWTHYRDEEDTSNVVESVYRDQIEFGCHDHVMDHFCSKSCIFYNQKTGMKPEIKPFSSQVAALTEFRKKILEGRGINLADIAPLAGILMDDYWILPGECAIFTGDTGMGKSALVQSIIVHASKRTLYLNLENAEELMTRRFLQIASGGVNKGTIDRILDRDALDQRDVDRLGHIFQVCIAPNLSEVADMVKDVQPEVLVIDTTDVIEVPEAGHNEMWQLKRIIEEMRKLAARFDIIVIGIHHINKRSSVENKVDLNSLTGNRANVTRMDHVFSITGVRDMKKRTIRTLKSRDSEPFSVPIMFDGARMAFYPVEIYTQEDEQQDDETDLFDGEDDDEPRERF